MKIVMYIGNECIDSVNINKQYLSQPGYIAGFIQQLKIKHQSVCANHDPEFLVYPLEAPLAIYGTDTPE